MDIPEGHMLVSTSELARIAAENAHLLRQITELQQHGTLREEQLRAYRRMELSKEQLEKIKKDLEETTARVLKSYGMEPRHEIPLPRVVNGAV
jgi:septation ring formation regulator EzrA